jgi:biotin transport system substrate-specific component
VSAVSAYAETLASPVVRRSPLIGRLMLAAAGVVLVAAAAQVSIPLPFTPVPITGQTFAVLLVGSTLGAPLACVSLSCYLLLGALGAPVYAERESGLDVLSGPTGGYLIGFALAALIAGRLAEWRWDRRFSTATAAMLAGIVVIYAAGLTWLAIDLNTDLERTLELGLYPFVVGDLLKLYLAALLLPIAWRIRDRYDPPGSRRSRENLDRSEL